MFRVCAVHKFQSYPALADQVLRLGTKSNAITTRAHVCARLSAEHCMSTFSLCFFQIVKERV